MIFTMLKGADGSDGQDGTDGKDGVNGTNGKDGVNGQDGANGTDGKTPETSGRWKYLAMEICGRVQLAGSV